MKYTTYVKDISLIDPDTNKPYVCSIAEHFTRTGALKNAYRIYVEKKRCPNAVLIFKDSDFFHPDFKFISSIENTDERRKEALDKIWQELVLEQWKEENKDYCYFLRDYIVREKLCDGDDFYAVDLMKWIDKFDKNGDFPFPHSDFPNKIRA